MKRRFFLLVLASMLAGCGGGTPVAVQEAAAGGGSLLEMINRLRASEGLPPLVEDGLLDAVAREHSEDQAEMKKTSHFGSSGGGYAYRLQRAGYSWEASQDSTQNVAYSPNPGGAQRALRVWGADGNHRRKFLKKNHDRVGIAESGGYWTVVMVDSSL